MNTRRTTVLATLAGWTLAGAGCGDRSKGEAQVPPETSAAKVSSLAPDLPAPVRRGTGAPEGFTGPAFDFRDADALRWGMRGTLVRHVPGFGLELGFELLFALRNDEHVIATEIGLRCDPCDPAARAAFDQRLGKLIGSRVNTVGIVRRSDAPGDYAITLSLAPDGVTAEPAAAAEPVAEEPASASAQPVTGGSSSSP
jgi:hypothetical protein